MQSVDDAGGDEDAKLFVMVPDRKNKGSWKMSLRKEQHIIVDANDDATAGTGGSSSSSKHHHPANNLSSSQQHSSPTSTTISSRGGERHRWGTVLLPSVSRQSKLPSNLTQSNTHHHHHSPHSAPRVPMPPALDLSSHYGGAGANTGRATMTTSQQGSDEIFSERASGIKGRSSATSRGDISRSARTTTHHPDHFPSLPTIIRLNSSRRSGIAVSGKTVTGRISQRLVDGGAIDREMLEAEKELALNQLSDFDAKLETKFALVSGMTSEIAEHDRSSGNPRGGGGGEGGALGGRTNSGVALLLRKSRTSNKPTFLPHAANIGGTAGTLAPLTSSSSSPQGGALVKVGGYQQGRRSTMLQEGKVRSPIFGLLAGVQPYQLRAAFDKLAILSYAPSTTTLTSLSLNTTNNSSSGGMLMASNASYGRSALAPGQVPSLVSIGLCIQDFQDLLGIVVPQMPLSNAYVERLMEGFETSINNGTRRLSLVNLIAQYGEGACPDVEKNILLFWSAFENAEIAQLPLSCLTKQAVRDYARVTRGVKGKPLQHWLDVSKALDQDQRLANVHSYAAAKLAAIERRKGQEKKMRKPTVFTRRFVNLQADREIISLFLDPTIEGGVGSQSNLMSGGGGGEYFGASRNSGHPLQRSGYDGNSSVTFSVPGGSSRGGGDGTSSLGRNQSTITVGGVHHANDPTEPCYCLSLQHLRVLVYGSEQLFTAFKHSLWIPPRINQRRTSTSAATSSAVSPGDDDDDGVDDDANPTTAANSSSFSSFNQRK